MRWGHGIDAGGMVLMLDEGTQLSRSCLPLIETGLADVVGFVLALLGLSLLGCVVGGCGG